MTAVDVSADAVEMARENVRRNGLETCMDCVCENVFDLLPRLEQEGKKPYDFIILDAPPSFGLLNLNALMTTDDLVIPVLGDFLSFHGLKLLFDTLQDLQTDLQLSLGGVFIVINSFNASFKLAKEAQAALQEHYSDYLCHSIVRQSTQFAQASSEGMPISLVAPDSKGALDLEALIDELLGRIANAPAASSI